MAEGQEYQLNTWYTAVRFSAMGGASFWLGGRDGGFAFGGDFAAGGHVSGGPALGVAVCRPHNEDSDSGAFSGWCISGQYNHLWGLDRTTHRASLGVEVFFLDAKLAVPLWLTGFGGKTEDGEAHGGGGISVGVMYRFFNPFLDKPLVNPYVSVMLDVLGEGGSNAGGGGLGLLGAFGLETRFF